MIPWLCSVYSASKNCRLREVVDEELSNFELTGRPQYDYLKQRTLLVLGAMANGQVTQDNMQRLVHSIISRDDSSFEELFSALTPPSPVEESKPGDSLRDKFTKALTWLRSGEFQKEPSNSTGSRSSSDRDFADHLQYAVNEVSAFRPVVEVIKEEILALLKDRIEAVHKILERKIKKDLRSLDEVREQVQKILPATRSEMR